MLKLHRLRKWFTIEETAKRLSITLEESVSPQDVLHLMADRHLAVFWHIQNRYGQEGAPVSYIRESGDPLFDLYEVLYGKRNENVKRIIERNFVYQSEFIVSLNGLYRVDDCFSKASSDWITSLGTGSGGDLMTLEGVLLLDSNGTYWRLMEKFSKEDQRKLQISRPPNHRYNFYPSVDLPSLDEVVVSREELERFEAQFREDDEAPTAPAPIDMSDRERGSLQKQIAALALVLAEKSGKYKRGNSPNAHQIAGAVEEILDALTEVNAHGVGKSALRANIAAGISLLAK